MAIAAARERRRTGLPLLRYGFRPFFLGAGLWAVVAMALRLGDISGSIVGGFALHDPTRWHAHEMLFGYASAVVAGFSLTAVPNWTGRLPISGMSLLALCLLWTAGRIALLTSFLPQPVAAAADAAFLPVLAAVLAREIVAGRNYRNVPVCGLILLLGSANALFHLEAIGLISAEGYGVRLAIGALSLLVGLIGGRIVPSFTNNWLGRQKLARSAIVLPWLERLTHASTVIAFLAWIAAPFAWQTGITLLIAGAAHALRLSRWTGWRAWREPLVFVLHAGYAWIAVGLLLLGFADIFDSAWSSAGLHALGAGAIGTMTLAVMTRATLGHTGRELHANRATVVLYAAITGSAIARVLAGLFAGAYVPLLIAAGAFWLVAFLLFVGVYGPMQLAPRVGDAS
ncbi:MAG: hypothetical protein GC190_17660 [Alphaproteobacteria bacterium]|nr:hypothetical protein [Alphaproteobacteria bacterium]